MHATRHRYECESESHGDQRRMCKKKLHTRRTVGKEIGDRRARWSEGECIALPEGLKTLNERSAASGKIRGSTHTHQRKSVQRESKSAASPWQDIQRGKKKNNTKPKRTYINIAGKWMAWVGAGQGIVAISASVQWLWTSHRFSSLFRSAHALSLSMALFFYANACYTLYIWSNIVFPSGLYHFK